MVLCGALLAPAILAGGLLAAQLTGYDAATLAAGAPDGAVDGDSVRRARAGQYAGAGQNAPVGESANQGQGASQGESASRGGNASSGGSAGQGMGAHLGEGAHQGGSADPGHGAYLSHSATLGHRLSEGDGARVGYLAGAERGMSFAPVWAPAPPHPDARYGGPIPSAPQARVPGRVVVAVPREVERVSTPKADVEERRHGWESREPGEPGESREPREPTAPGESRWERPSEPEGCPGEWEETWLWEVCQEHQRRLA
ncbi:hypothetical protein GCM10018965_082460 [Nonomuraea roseola]